jgi:hypothetical protein
MATAKAIPYLKTPVAARQLGVSYSALMNLLRFDVISPPRRDSSGDYVFTEATHARVEVATQQ